MVHVAHCYPYTYTDLQCQLAALEADPVRKHYVRRETLTHSLAGNACDLLTITSPVPGGAAAGADALKRRKGALLSARVHPGETNASWMMKGAIDYLTGPSLDARVLRDNFVFKVVPMLNPDGVIVVSMRGKQGSLKLEMSGQEGAGSRHLAKAGCRSCMFVLGSTTCSHLQPCALPLQPLTTTIHCCHCLWRCFPQGNYRCSLAGMDLNRVWNDPSKKLHPVIYAVKALAKQLSVRFQLVRGCAVPKL